LPEHDPRLRYQVMMLLDEFTALGRIPIIAEAISYLPGYNVRVVLVIQTPAQLREVYGAHNAETMLKSLAVRIVFAPKDYADAREIADELGNTTVKVKSVSRPMFDLFDAKARRSVSVSEQRRPLLLPQEVKELGTEAAIVFYEGARPIRCRKIRYYTDSRFRSRVLPPPALPAPTWQAPSITGEPTMSVVNHESTSEARAPPAEAAPLPPTREATLDDIERLDTLTLEDFGADFSQVKIPTHEGRMTEQELSAAVDSFLDSLRSR
jgi:type IV secretion system protein VirD4